MPGMMGGAFGQQGGVAGGYGAPTAGYGDPNAAGAAGGAFPEFAAPPAGWSPQGFTSTTVIDASGGQPPVVLSSGGALDQATLDRINRALYEHGLGTDASAAAMSAATGAIGAGSPGMPSGATGAGAGTPSPAGATGGFGLLDPKQAERLAAVGYTGRATVDAFQDTGVATGDAHLYTFGLTVHVDGRPDQRVRYAAMVPQRAIGRIANGATLPVRVDPLDTTQLLVEWDNG